jgi:hypothetical protein
LLFCISKRSVFGALRVTKVQARTFGGPRTKLRGQQYGHQLLDVQACKYGMVWMSLRNMWERMWEQISGSGLKNPGKRPFLDHVLRTPCPPVPFARPAYKGSRTCHQNSVATCSIRGWPSSPEPERGRKPCLASGAGRRWGMGRKRFRPPSAPLRFSATSA